jgi:glycosyltransferase involved in cell wall biosynthesis
MESKTLADKIVALEGTGNIHSLYKELIDYPPVGYKVISDSHFAANSLRKIQSTVAARALLTSSWANILPASIVLPAIRLRNRVEGAFLTYSSGHIVFRDEKWLVDMEYVSQLAGYNLFALRRWRNLLNKFLADDRCIAVLAWTESGLRTIRSEFRSKEIQGKSAVLRLSCSSRKVQRVRHQDETVFLFVSSVNFPGEFESKGGREAILAFLELNRMEKNTKFICRAKVPRAYQEIIGRNPNIELIQDVLPWSELEDLFLRSDVFVFPGHQTPGKVILDAMSYSLPVIATDVWATREMVTPDNGLLIGISPKIPYCLEEIHPNWGSKSFTSAISQVDTALVSQLTDAMQLLHRDPGLRERLGQRGRLMVDEGEFSLARRNRMLREIFSRAE